MSSHRVIRSLLRLLVVALVSLSTATTLAGSTISPILTNSSTGHRYVLLRNDTWQASEAEASALGGHLVTINDAAEQDWIFETFARYGGVNRLLWIGLNDAATEGQFIWSSGEAVTFTAWAPGEPNSIESEDYVAIFYPGHHAQNQWNDWGTIRSDPIGLPLNGVVEFSSSVSNVSLISLGATWKYHDTGANLGSGWRELNASEAGWNTGRAPLGYGDGDESTIVRFGNDPQNKHLTTYFRHSFTVPDPTNIAKLNLRLLRDDGAVIYLNGTEVFRSNMPDGAIAFDTRASSAAGDEDESVALHTAAINPALLQVGRNVLAVEVHQAAPDSSDLSFDLELNALGHVPPVVSITVPNHSELLAAGSPVLLKANAVDDLGIASVEFRINAQFVGRVTNAPFQMYWSNATVGSYSVVAIATDTSGLSTASAPTFFKLGAELVSSRAIWRYLDSGVMPVGNWTLPSFDDSLWSFGPAKLGYGEGDEATVVGFGSDQANKHITTWFRREFTILNPETISALQLRLIRDDGAAVYLNGSEVFRSNLPMNTALLPGTLALTTVGGNDERTMFRFHIPSAALVAGRNILAAEVHQADSASSDLSFALELVAEHQPASPSLNLKHTGDLLDLTWNTANPDWILETSSDLDSLGGSWTPVNTPTGTDGWNHHVTMPAAERTKFFRLRFTPR